jgi:hypothetical protein
MKNNILFCCEKWCAGTPLMGLTNNFHNMFNSFSQTQNDYMYNTLHLDEASAVYGTHIDNIIIQYCQNFKPSIIIFCLLGGSNVNPSMPIYQKLKDMGIKLCFMWPDTQKWVIDTILHLKDIADLSVSWDNPVSDLHSRVQFPENHKFMWVPQDEHFFYDDKKDIDVSFVGSTIYPDRQKILSGIIIRRQIHIDGGQRTRQLTPEEYSKIIRSSKISLTFSKSPCQTYEQTKGRVYEVLRSKSLLLESKNTSTSRYLKPGEDYVEFEGLEDLDNKIEYYLNNEEERIRIATNGYNKYYANYSSQIFWNKILENLNQ